MSVCSRCVCRVCTHCWRSYTSGCWDENANCPMCRNENIELDLLNGPETRSQSRPRRRTELVRKLSHVINQMNREPFSESKLVKVRGIFQTLHNLRGTDVDLLEEHARLKEVVRLKLIEMYNVDGWEGAATFYNLLFGSHLVE